ncbi:hypothetical protein ANCCAN_05809 [Ancylostoma caninum]|uniref:ET module n=1 Tax=Ancylostoma caninum TaxID=29170 RepID=A0A368GUY1_ANCCA|nr:hypothetical protein ANCCAN_05809 [Ancylostoma caninum]
MIHRDISLAEMSSLGQFLLLAMISCTVAIRCYKGYTYDKEKPSMTMDCPMSRYCTKTVSKLGKQDMNTYWCDAGICSKDGCTKGINDDVNCCCSKDLCNTSSRTYAFLAILPVVMLKIFL